jgi:ribosome production factor 2
MAKKRALAKKKASKMTRSDGEKVEYFKQKSKAMEVEAKSKPKSHKVKKLIEKKEKILQKDPKHSLFIRGLKLSLPTKRAIYELDKMRDMFLCKTLLQKPNKILPFEDTSYIEYVADKHDAGFVCFGSHNKKRPDNLVIHRMYNHQVLDMVEVGIGGVITMQEFTTKTMIETGQQPILLFQGDPFDLSEKHIKFKNMMIDFFRIKHLKTLNIIAAQRIISFTASSIDGEILLQQFQAGIINEGLAGDENVDIQEIGPKIEMTIRRVKHADNDMWKSATKILRSKTKILEKKRNISTNVLGQRVGKAYIQHQDLGTLALKKPQRKRVVEKTEPDKENTQDELVNE